MVCAGQNRQARAPSSILVVLFIGVLGAATASNATAAVTEEKSFPDLAAVLEEAQEMLSGVEQKPSPLTNAWSLFSEFNYLHPADAVLDIAYPSSVCSYFATVVPAGENYTFTGTFFNESDSVFQCTMMVYTVYGDLAPGSPQIYNKDVSGEQTIVVDNTENDKLLWVLQRFYVDRYQFSRRDLISALFKVTKTTDHGLVESVPSESQLVRSVLSRALSVPLRVFLRPNTPLDVRDSPTSFALTGTTASLFPDASHVYLFANMAAEKSAFITGNFQPNSTAVYMDFIVVNQLAISTESALPFYEITDADGNYNISIAAPDYTGEVNEHCLRWKRRNQYPMVLMRLITYDFDKHNFTGPLSPEETRQLYGDIYPSIQYPFFAPTESSITA